MCGITGIININKGLKPLNKEIVSMTSSLKHRGPDDEGYMLSDGETFSPFYGTDTKIEAHSHIETSYNPKKNINTADNLNTKYAIGFRRLSILDTTFLGHQPMSYKERYWIVFNGEIFNYLEIKSELIGLGQKFISNTDTEVILAAYDCWGSKCLEKFNGMWAFVIIDSMKNRIFMSRDRFGEKPLYYYYSNGTFIFSSEIKAILNNSEVATEPKISYLKKYIEKGCKVDQKETAFENIFSFPSASYLECEVKDLVNITDHLKKFWELKTNKSNSKFKDSEKDRIAKEYYDLLSNSVELRMRSDVKVGSTLSGGLDSTSITYLIRESLNKTKNSDIFETFSNIYTDKQSKKFDESFYIDIVSKLLKVKSNKTEPDLENIRTILYQIVYYMDVPPSDSAISGWSVYKKIQSSNVKVTLDGQGADEQLTGYLSYYYTYLFNVPYSHLMKEFFAIYKLPGIDKGLLSKTLLLKFFKSIFGRSFTEKFIKRISENFNSNQTLNEQLKSDTETSLQSLLHYGDRLSMAHSIESRSPFMDYRLVEFIASIPSAYKIHGGWSKYIARIAFSNKLPEEIVWRKDKMGFPNDNEYWFREKNRNWMIETIKNSGITDHFINKDQLEIKIEADRSIEKVLRVLLIAIWYDIFFAGNKHFLKRSNE